MANAVSIGVVYSDGKIARVFNPDYEWQLDQHHLGPNEFMLRVKKADHGISGKMSLEDLHRLLEAMP